MTAISLVDLPDEILDKSFRLLLPFSPTPLISNLPFSSSSRPTPEDLLNCRLVSRNFDRLASQYAFRRLSLRLSMHVREYNLKTALEKHAFLRRYSRIALFVRVFTLELDAPWHSPQLYAFLTDVVKDLFVPFFEGMINLRGLSIGGWNMGSSEIFDAIILSLVTNKPDLQALYLDGIMVPPVVPGHLPPSLQIFHLRSEREQSQEYYNKVLKSCRALHLGTAPLEMPWASLEELSVNVEDNACLERLCASIRTWLENNPSQSLALRHLSLQRSQVRAFLASADTDAYIPFLRALSVKSTVPTNHLRSLTITGNIDHTFDIRYDPCPFISFIAFLFPNLEEFGLLTEYLRFDHYEKFLWNDESGNNKGAFDGMKKLRVWRTCQSVLIWFLDWETRWGELPDGTDGRLPGGIGEIEAFPHEDGEKEVPVRMVSTLPSLEKIYTSPPLLPSDASADSEIEVDIAFPGVIHIVRGIHGGFRTVRIANDFQAGWKENALFSRSWQTDGDGEM